jgi:hypothetical protein
MNKPDFNGFASRVKSRLDEVFSDEFTFQNEKPEDELGLETWHTARKLLPGESHPEATDVARIAGVGDERLLKRDFEQMRSILREELTRFMDNLLDPALARTAVLPTWTAGAAILTWPEIGAAASQIDARGQVI